MDLIGIHHLTAVSSRIQDNYKFYTQVMGLRLVKRSVNQDDVSAYHLFYSGDRRGAPGNDLTFFDWEVPSERRGTHSIVGTGLRVEGQAALSWWSDWFKQHGTHHQAVQEIDGRATLLFEDPEGQRLALVNAQGDGDPVVPWEKSPVPAAFQVRGQGPIWLSVPDLRPTEAVLTQVLNMRQVRQYKHPAHGDNSVYVFEMGPGGAHAEIHVAVEPHLKPVYPGAGGVHHVAFRTPTYEQYDAWVDKLKALRIPNSGPVDRFWFRSLYFREPNGILFEIATDEPGFGVDENVDHLGESVVLPPFLESKREEIVANLKPLD